MDCFTWYRKHLQGPPACLWHAHSWILWAHCVPTRAALPGCTLWDSWVPWSLSSLWPQTRHCAWNMVNPVTVCVWEEHGSTRALFPTFLSCLLSLQTLRRYTELFVLPLWEVCSNLSIFILQSQMEFEAQVFKDPNKFNYMWKPKCLAVSSEWKRRHIHMVYFSCIVKDDMKLWFWGWGWAYLYVIQLCRWKTKFPIGWHWARSDKLTWVGTFCHGDTTGTICWSTWLCSHLGISEMNREEYAIMNY